MKSQNPWECKTYTERCNCHLEQLEQMAEDPKYAGALDRINDRITRLKLLLRNI